MTTLTLDHLRGYAIARTLFKPTTLGRAIDKLGFVQADPIRAPARAQDLTLRHRVVDYRAGDLERRYARLGVEDALIKAGAQPGASVTIGDVSFDWEPQTPAGVEITMTGRGTDARLDQVERIGASERKHARQVRRGLDTEQE